MKSHPVHIYVHYLTCDGINYKNYDYRKEGRALGGERMHGDTRRSGTLSEQRDSRRVATKNVNMFVDLNMSILVIAIVRRCLLLGYDYWSFLTIERAKKFNNSGLKIA